MDMSNTQNLSGLWKASQWVRQNNQHTASEHPATPYQSSQNCLLFKTLHTHHPLQFFSLSPTQLLRCNPPQEHQPCLTSTHILPWRACTSSREVTLNLHQLEWTEKIWLFPSSIHFPSIKKKLLTLLEIHWNPRFKTPRSFWRWFQCWIWSEMSNEENKGKSSNLSSYFVFTTKIHIFEGSLCINFILILLPFFFTWKRCKNLLKTPLKNCCLHTAFSLFFFIDEGTENVESTQKSNCQS